MSTQTQAPVTTKFKPYVPASMQMPEFTVRAVVLGLFLTGILGAANAYLGLKAGMTIAATYPAAVIGMAILRLMKGSLLEENIARTIGSIGESVAAGAVFTIPAFVLARSLARAPGGEVLAGRRADGHRRIARHPLRHAAAPRHGGRRRTSLPRIGGRLGNSQSRTAGIESREDPVRQHGLRRAHQRAGQLNVFEPVDTFASQHRATSARSSCSAPAPIPTCTTITTGGATIFNSPDISPAYFGVGYIIGPRLAALNFAGGVLAWGLLVPLLTFVIGPSIAADTAGRQPFRSADCRGCRLFLHRATHRRRRHAGGRVASRCSACASSSWLGIARAITDLKKSAEAHEATGPHRTRPQHESRLHRRGHRLPRDDRALLLLHRRCG